MEQTYNDIMAENQRLKDSLDVMIDKNAELIFREKALKAEIQKLRAQFAKKKNDAAPYDELRKEFAFVVGQLHMAQAYLGLPRYDDEEALKRIENPQPKDPETAVCRQDCKVISINR